MRRFEVGKTYGDNAVVYEITKRTQKTVTYRAVQHSGRYNERKSEEAKKRIRIWGDKEVIFISDETVIA